MATEADAQLYGGWQVQYFTAIHHLRADPKAHRKKPPRQSGLWGYAISGDFPIVLLRSVTMQISTFPSN